MMKTMTIRNIPDPVARWLADEAVARRTSVNQTTVAVLTSAACPAMPRKRRDLSAFAGTWSKADGQAFDKIVRRAFEKVNPADWGAPT